jgi:FlaA1/EpsC-like NDP-sugar epimerase
VLDSAGSVVPLFRQQIAQGGPVTITHPEVTRFFMTIPEASQLILQATMMGEGSEIFVLDMGSPIKIHDLAEQMIKLMGLKPGEDIEIKFVGLRPGEKLYETLFHENESLIHTEHNKIMRARYRPLDRDVLFKILDAMGQACQKDDEVTLRRLLLELVPEYQSHTLDACV